MLFVDSQPAACQYHTGVPAMAFYRAFPTGRAILQSGHARLSSRSPSLEKCPPVAIALTNRDSISTSSCRRFSTSLKALSRWPLFLISIKLHGFRSTTNFIFLFLPFSVEFALLIETNTILSIPAATFRFTLLCFLGHPNTLMLAILAVRLPTIGTAGVLIERLIRLHCKAWPQAALRREDPRLMDQQIAIPETESLSDAGVDLVLLNLSQCLQYTSNGFRAEAKMGERV
jgi:hypothetical protein